MASPDTSTPRDRPGQLPQPPDDNDRDNLVWRQCEEQFAYYDHTAATTRRAYVTLKTLSLLVAASVPVLAATHAIATLTASLAATVVVIEGIIQLLQLQTNWISYRSTAEALRQHAFLYAAGIGSYADPATRTAQLAQQIRELTTNESATWTDSMRNSPKTK
jgi:hypothetical protein